MESVHAAILSASLDEPCGPCHLPLPPEDEPTPTNNGDFDPEDQSQTKAKSQSQVKMSSIANMYASSNVARPIDGSRLEAVRYDHFGDTDIKLNMPHSTVEETIDEQEENVQEGYSETTRKPERKKNKNKQKKGKHEKEKKKKRKRVEEIVTSTSKPMDVEVQECNCRMEEMVRRDMKIDPREDDGWNTKDCGCANPVKEEREDRIQEERAERDNDECNCRLQETVARDMKIDPREDGGWNTGVCQCGITDAKPEEAKRDCNCRLREMVVRDIDPALRETYGINTDGCECGDSKLGGDRGSEHGTQQTDAPSVDQATNDEDVNLVALSEMETENEIIEIIVGNDISPSTETTVLRSRVVWPTDKRDFGRDKNRGKKERNLKETQMELQHDIDEGMEIVREEQGAFGYPDVIEVVIETEENVLDEIEAVDEGTALGLQEEGYGWNQGVENSLTREDGDATFTVEQEGLSLLADGVQDDTFMNVGEVEEDDVLSMKVTVGEIVWGQDELEGGRSDKKKQEGKSKDVAKKGKEKDRKYKKVEKVEKGWTKKREDEVPVHDAWVDTEEESSQEFILNWPSEEAEREEELKPWPVAMWKAMTVAPTVHDPRSSGDSEDQTRRIAVYTSEDSSVGDKNTLHSKAQPWAKGKQ